MGILNVTPDSFSGDGLATGDDAVAAAVAQARAFVAAGADILDIGGESSRPGAEPLTPEAESARVLPVIAAVRAALPDVPISVDTYRASVAAAALDAGADIVNDIWALRADPGMAALVAARGVPVVLMHNRSRPNAVLADGRLGSEYVGATYAHVIEDVARELLQAVDEATAAGIARESIVLDPGIGFGKTLLQNLALINHLDRLKALVGLPVLLGTSRKSFIGRVLDLPVEERLEGTLATLAVGIARGADIVRVHDVAAAVRVARMTDAILAAPADGSGP